MDLIVRYHRPIAQSIGFHWRRVRYLRTFQVTQTIISTHNIKLEIMMSICEAYEMHVTCIVTIAII